MPSILSQDAIGHPQLDFTIHSGMTIMENLTNTDVIEWLIDYNGWNKPVDMFFCNNYMAEQASLQRELGLSDLLWKYFNFDQMLLDDFIYRKNTFIVMKQDNEMVLLDDVEAINVIEWFKGHPSKEVFYIVRYA